MITNALISIVTAWVYMLTFYTLYIAAINIYEDWASIAPWLKVLIWPIPAVMVGCFDIPFNLIAATVIFFDFPQELTLTSRLARYKSPATAPGLRKDIAQTICSDALNPFAPSKRHC